MGNVFDCRYKDVIRAYDQIEAGKYLAILDTEIPVHFDDLLITKGGDLMVFDYVKPSEIPNQYEGRLIDVDMVVSTNKVPQYRPLKRAILSQLKRQDRK